YMLKVQLDQQLKISRTLLSSYIYTSAHSGFIQENIESHNLRNSSFFIPFKHASADRSANSASNFSLNIPSCFFMRQIVAPFRRSISIKPSIFNIWYVLFTVIVFTPASRAN